MKNSPCIKHGYRQKGHVTKQAVEAAATDQSVGRSTSAECRRTCRERFIAGSSSQGCKYRVRKRWAENDRRNQRPPGNTATQNIHFRTKTTPRAGTEQVSRNEPDRDNRLLRPLQHHRRSRLTPVLQEGILPSGDRFRTRSAR